VTRPFITSEKSKMQLLKRSWGKLRVEGGVFSTLMFE
jgi:hypothetical protein